MNNPVNFRANQRYKLLRSEQERRAKVFDRDMNSLMGYILGISCNLSNSTDDNKLGRKPRPGSSTPVGRIKGPFARYSDTRHFLKSQEWGNKEGRPDERREEVDVRKGDSKRRVKERKHVRFKVEPQVHIIEPQVENWNLLDRPSSAPTLINQHNPSPEHHRSQLDPHRPQLDHRLLDPFRKHDHQPRLFFGNTRSLDQAKVAAGDRTIEFTSLDFNLHPKSNKKLLTSCWTNAKYRNYLKNGRGTTLSSTAFSENGFRSNRTRSCWEASKVNGFSTAQIGS